MSDEYVLDTPGVRAFVAVGGGIGQWALYDLLPPRDFETGHASPFRSGYANARCADDESSSAGG